jgi:hypothetical protein
MKLLLRLEGWLHLEVYLNVAMEILLDASAFSILHV